MDINCFDFCVIIVEDIGGGRVGWVIDFSFDK